MYVEPGFYELIPGTIGTVHYMFDVSKKMTDEEKEKLVDKMSNERMRAYMNNLAYSLGNAAPMAPEEAFAKARRDSRTDIEEKWTAPRELNVQVGQMESYNAMLKVEKMDGFRGWMNPLLVESLKLICEKEKTT